MMPTISQLEFLVFEPIFSCKFNYLGFIDNIASQVQLVLLTRATKLYHLVSQLFSTSAVASKIHFAISYSTGTSTGTLSICMHRSVYQTLSQWLR